MRYLFTMSTLLALLAAALPAATVRADLLSLTDGTSNFNYDTNSPGNVGLSGADGSDILAEMDWMLRFNSPGLGGGSLNTRLASIGGGGEAGAMIQSSVSAVPSQANVHYDVDWVTLAFPDPIVAQMFDIDIEYSLSTWESKPILAYSVTITNVSGFTQNGLSLANYVDYDLDGYDADIGSIKEVNGNVGFTQRDKTTGRQIFHGFDAVDAIQIQEWQSGANNLDDLFLAGGDITNTGTEFGPGDMTAAFQWDFSLAAGESFTVNGFTAVPEPSSFGLLAAIGSATGIAIVLRRRKRTA